MNWNGINGFLAMGGYGAFVWGAYGVALLVIVTEIATLRRRRSLALIEARRLAVSGPVEQAATAVLTTTHRS